MPDIDSLWRLPQQIDTPALVVDHDSLIANLDAMAATMESRGVALRPHAKTHKSPDLGKLQLSRGASGLSVATLGEAEVFAGAGITDLFIAYPLYVGRSKADRFRELAKAVDLAVGVDSEDAARALAATGSAPHIRVMVEIDSGQHRTGVDPEAAGPLAAACERLGLVVDGVFTHGGHGYRNPEAPAYAARDEKDALARAVDSLSRSGIEARTVSAGSTPTALGSAGAPVNEERPGTYVFNDRQQLELGSANPSQISLRVAATVVSTAVSGQVVLDAGSKSLSSDRPLWLEGHGVVPELNGAMVVSLSECHGVLRLPNYVDPPAVGTVVSVIPNHVCSVVNLFEQLDVVSNGEVVDRWAVAARGHLS